LTCSKNNTIQSKINVKNERALTAILEHEELLSHRLLGFFPTDMLMHKIATKGANSTYPSNLKKTPSVLIYTELKVVTVLSYVLLSYVILSYVILNHVILSCYIELRYIELCYIELCFIELCYIELCYICVQ
jgi:hypothetical protein